MKVVTERVDMAIVTCQRDVANIVRQRDVAMVICPADMAIVIRQLCTWAIMDIFIAAFSYSVKFLDFRVGKVVYPFRHLNVHTFNDRV